MYSVVLMMAMTGGADVPAGLFGHGDCHGSYYSDCSGSCTGYYTTSSWSCHGGYSCHGSSYGHSWSGHGGHSCHGSCYGNSWSCHGGYSCYGSAYYEGYSCNGCCGGGFFHGHRHHRSYDNCCQPVCDSCNSGWSCVGSPVAPAAPVVKPDDKKTSEITAPATIVVSLPADAKLTIDDATTVSTSTRRVFVSPELPAGREFTYTLKAEYTKNGKPVLVTRDVAVRAGAEVAVTIEEGLAGIASR
jgi:uncharacterized protein (TIGR03000 family)